MSRITRCRFLFFSFSAERAEFSGSCRERRASGPRVYAAGKSRGSGYVVKRTRVCEARAIDALRHSWHFPPLERYRTKGVLINSIRLGIEPRRFFLFSFFFSLSSLSFSFLPSFLPSFLRSLPSSAIERFVVELPFSFFSLFFRDIHLASMLNRANPEIYDYRFFPSLLLLPPLSFNLFTIAVGKKKRDEGRRRGGPSTFWPGKTTVALNVWYLVSTHLRQCVPLWHWRGREKWSGGGRGRKNKRGTAVAEATTAAAFAPSPFSTLFALQQARRGEEGRGGRMTRARRNDIFHRARALSTVISTKIRQRLAIVLEYPRARVLRAQILPRFFFSSLSLSLSSSFFLSFFLSRNVCTRVTIFTR